MLEKQVSFTIVKDCVEDREMQSLTFSFVSTISSKLITVSCISMVLSLVKITGQLLRKFGRCYQSKNSLVEACNQHLCKSFLTLSNTSQKPPSTPIDLNSTGPQFNRSSVLVSCLMYESEGLGWLSERLGNPDRMFPLQTAGL